MRIKQISVQGLFGIFNHVIPLKTGDRITIIHGPNGFGKTTLLRILNGFFNSRYFELRKIPFHNFIVGFDNSSYVDIAQDSQVIEPTNKKTTLVVNFVNSANEKYTYTLPDINESPDLDVSLDLLDELVPGLERVGARQWIYLPSDESLSTGEVIDRFSYLLPPRIKPRGEPEWLENLKNDIHIHLIESQRLLNVFPSRSSRIYRRIPSMLPTVSAYSDELVQLIKSKLAEYGTVSQSLDRTFPRRVVQQQQDNSAERTPEQLSDKLDELARNRSRLVEVGLLDKDENSDFDAHKLSIDEKTQNILSVYVDDVEKKLDVFNEVASKIELLQRIINKKFAYSYKEMKFSKEKGFVFKNLYNSSPTTETITPTDLSSGEQHELVLLYELLFKVQPNSLVLIDEPELSLHVGWQIQFLKDLQEISKLADIDILMATHSPGIIDDRWDLTVELQRPTQ